MRNNNVQLVTEVLDSLNNLSGKDTAAAELAGILQEPHFKVIPKLSLDFILTLRVPSGYVTRGSACQRGLWLIASGRRRAREVRQPCSLTHTLQLGAGGALLLQ